MEGDQLFKAEKKGGGLKKLALVIYSLIQYIGNRTREAITNCFAVSLVDAYTYTYTVHFFFLTKKNYGKWLSGLSLHRPTINLP